MLQMPVGTPRPARVRFGFRDGNIGQGVAQVGEVIQQRHDGMTVGGHREFDLAAFGERAVTRNQARHAKLHQMEQFVAVG